VIQIGGTYLMAYADPMSSGHPVCIHEAVSSNGYQFTAASFSYCSYYGTNFIDPQFFLDNKTGALWMLFSSQWNNCGQTVGTPGEDSALFIQQMNSDGQSIAAGTTPTELLSWDQANAIQNKPASFGSLPCLENPNIIDDSTGGWNPYDLLFSMGTWNGGGNTYVTGEVDCTALNNTSSGCGIDPGAGSVYLNPGGGASTLFTSDASGNYVMYADWLYGIRQDYVGGPTTRCDPSTDPHQCT
jgi:hypothetical protein